MLLSISRHGNRGRMIGEQAERIAMSVMNSKYTNCSLTSDLSTTNSSNTGAVGSKRRRTAIVALPRLQLYAVPLNRANLWVLQRYTRMRRNERGEDANDESCCSEGDTHLPVVVWMKFVARSRE